MAVSTDTFTKLVSIAESAQISKAIAVEAVALGNSALGTATADAIGAFSHTETLTQTTAVQGVGSSSASESLSVANTPTLAVLLTG
jgi:hypothetical protein